MVDRPILNGRAVPRDAWLWSLVVGDPRQLDRYALMLQLYLDESEHGSALLAGGLLASVVAWEELAYEWNAILESKPVVPTWHTSDAYAHPKESPFQDWTADLFNSRVKRLWGAIGRIEPIGITARLERTVYDSLMKDKIEIPRGLDTEGRRKRAQAAYGRPWYLLHAGVLSVALGEIVRLELREPVEIVIEMQDDLTDEMIRYVLDYLIGDNLRPLVSGIRFERKGNGRPLEAADLYLWFHRRAVTGMPHPLWPSFQGLVRNCERTIEPEIVKMWVDELNKTGRQLKAELSSPDLSDPSSSPAP